MGLEMAVARLLLLCALAACGSEPMHLVVDDPVVTLRLDPPAAQVAVGGSLQFTAVGRTADGAERAVFLTWHTTTGTISNEGLFRAGSEDGVALVVATCSCGVADTATVTVTAAPVGEAAVLRVDVSGLPTGVLPVMTLVGPGGFELALTTTAVIPALTPGAYQLSAGNVTLDGYSYIPDPASTAIALMPAGHDTVTVVYHRTNPDGTLPHPRVWMTPTRIAHLKAQAAANTVRWTRVKSASDKQLSRGAAYTSSDLKFLPDLCLTYLATNDQRYAARADVILRGYAVAANDLTGDSGYGIRFLLPVVTMGLDWCYGGLSPTARQQAATWLMDRADWVWPESNPDRPTGYGTKTATTNYFWGFLMTGPAALAAAEDDTGHGVLSGTNRPAFHQALALARWNDMGLPYLLGTSEGGAWTEGTNYESTWRLASFVDAFNTAGHPLSEPFLEASLRWRIHSTMPGGKFKVPFGDQPRVSTAPIYKYDRMAALYALDASATAPADLRAQVYHWLDLIGEVATSETGTAVTLADELLRFDPQEPVASGFTAMPRDYLAPGPGFFIYRSSWTDPNTTVMAFQSGPNQGHGGLSQNSLMIWKGKFWITADANIYSHSGTQGETDRHNTLTVGGKDQTLYDGNGGQIIGSPQVSDRLVVVRAQARDAYGRPGGGSSGRTVANYLRTVAFLPQQDVFVIVDQATTVDAALTKTWRWHMKDPPQVSGRNFTLEGEARDYRCFGSVLAPTDVVVGTQAFSLGLNAAAGVTSHAVTVTTPARASDVVVTVLQCTGASSPPAAATATLTTGEAVVVVGGTRVTVPFTDTAPVRIE
jgi:hypothetical protein